MENIAILSGNDMKNNSGLTKDSFDASFLFEDGEFERKTGRSDYVNNVSVKIKNSFYYDKDNDCIFPEFAEFRDCPVCGGDKKEKIFTKDGFEHVKCSDCQFVYVDPILSEAAMARHYREEDNWTKVMLNEHDCQLNKKMYIYALELIQKHGAFKSILDVGAGTGFFVQTASELGFDALGIELNENMLKRASSKGINMENISMASLRDAGRKFDLVTSWFVLEHVSHPEEFVAEMASLLDVGGLLFIGVPNIDSLATRLNYKDSSTFAGNSHINFFNCDFLKDMAGKAGFSLLCSDTCITQLNGIKKYFRILGLTENSGLNDFLSELTSKYIHKNLLGAYLFCLFRKN
jgi:ubiquinone/menaquinone biosynthesis C-methylase UbiE